MFVKIRVVRAWIITHQYIVYLLLLPHCTHFKIFYAVEIIFFRHLVVWLCSILGLCDTWGVTAPVQGPSGSPRVAAGGGEADQRRVDFWN